MPTAYLSTPRLTLDGSPATDVSANVLALAVEETTLGMTTCELRLANFGDRATGGAGFLNLGRDVVDFGTALAVERGATGERRTVFEGVVTALQADYPAQAPAELLVLAEDHLQELRLTRRTRTFTDATADEVARQVAAEHGLTARVDLDAPARPVAAQLNQSDLAFLREVARRDDAEVWLDGTDLHLARRPDRGAGSLTLTYGGDLLAFSVRADLADQCSTVEVTGWDVAAKDAVAESAGPDVLAVRPSRNRHDHVASSPDVGRDTMIAFCSPTKRSGLIPVSSAVELLLCADFASDARFSRPLQAKERLLARASRESRLHLADGIVLLRPDSQVFAAMLNPALANIDATGTRLRDAR